MNREIKFRAWDFYAKKMVYSGFSVPNDGWRRIEGDEHFDLEIMQFTGLKDKNGKEIYEGDILRNNDENWEVGFDEGGYWMRLREGKHKFIFINEAQHSEVIGNIYENPELLS